MKKMLGIILMAALMAGGSTSSAMAADIDPAGEQWGFIFEQLTNPNYVTMSGVALDYCEELGIELQIVDGGESSDTIINAAENMATLGYQVILLSPMAVEIAGTAAEAAKAINPDIIVVNSAIECESCDYSLLQDDYTSGIVCADEAAAFAEEHGLTQAILLGYPRDQALIDREEAFIAEMKEKAPDVEVLNIDMSSYEIQEFTSISENLMTTYPECRIVYAISDVVMSYFYEALQASGKDTSEWALYSVDGSEDGVTWIYAGSGYLGTADTGTLEIPQGLVDVALRLEAGENPEDIEVTLPVTMITSENIDEYAEKIGYEK
ncbi:sugar ABC transporter substrate-binding protein [Marvinbryantia sp.]|uniref:sugar ABC transporter substrate-binding protein n=1 Tax=Marvinbryantia sp. TaxID=2496532 RepID=UPI0025D309DD|nr:sugar ABC transporter substrate-binding protein [uncultured Marvinbryantia sp.]